LSNVELNDKDALQNFILNNDELEKLEELTSTFNIFESLDIIKQEIRHSNFLAWIMNPKESHGIGDYFIKRFLLEITALAIRQGVGDITPIEIDTCELADVKVEREWKFIDIVVIDEENKIVCAIENKIEATESRGQLDDYQAKIDKDFNEFKKLFVFLTPDARRASNDKYICISYTEVCNIIEHIIRAKSNQIGSEVKVFLCHYTEMLRRHVMVDSEIQDLCQRIYTKHQKALDLIFENKPDTQKEIHDYLIDLINNEGDLAIDDSPKTNIRFGVKPWDIEMLQVGEGWTSTGRLLLFEFYNSVDTLNLYLVIGPGDANTRNRIYDVAHANTNLFKTANRRLTSKWSSIYKERFLSKSDFEHTDIDILKPKIQKKWMNFIAGDFRQITALIDTVLQ